ncbi:phosphatase [Clostridium sp.]|uniref:phosphatase n=1 Tax=Clostridium sp. TaxID=1506 RepID=UPI002FC74F40
MTKKFIYTLIIILTINTFFSPTIHGFSTYSNKPNSNYIVLDSQARGILPNKFRIDDSLNISGSSQFTPEELPNIKNKINHPSISIIDLRQESHGFINDIAISFYSPSLNLNNGLTTSKILSEQTKLLAGIPLNRRITIYHKTLRPALNPVAASIYNEGELCRKNNFIYVRLPVDCSGIPSPETVDQFVAMMKYKVHDSHLHFHCDSGEARTTTFMTMYQIFRQGGETSLTQIINSQISLGGSNILDSSHRADFINEFYNYINSNKSSNYRVPYSVWITQSKLR